MKVKYLLFETDFDENESNLYQLNSLSEIEDYFCCSEENIGDLLVDGVFHGDWHSYHLVHLADFQ